MFKMAFKVSIIQALSSQPPLHIPLESSMEPVGETRYFLNICWNKLNITTVPWTTYTPESPFYGTPRPGVQPWNTWIKTFTHWVHWEGVVLWESRISLPGARQPTRKCRTQLLKSKLFPWLYSGFNQTLKGGRYHPRKRPMSEAQKDCDIWCPKISKEKKCPTQNEDRRADCWSH